MSVRTPRSDRGKGAKTGLCAAAGGAFTLVELLMVILILAIVGAVVVPMAVGTTSMQAQSAARIVMSDLEYAQNQAIVTQVDITVTFDTNGNSYSVSNESGTLIHPITKQAYTVDFDTQRGLGSVALSSASFNGQPSVTFGALGSPDAEGTVTVAAGSHGYTVTVAPITGRVSVSAVE